MNERAPFPDCAVVQPELGAFFDRELTSTEAAAIECHLATCTSCRAEAELLRMMMRSLRLIPRPQPSEAARARLLAQVIAEPPLHRTEIVCSEQLGGQVIRYREVMVACQPAFLRSQEPVTIMSSRRVIERYQQESGGGSNRYRVIECLWEERP